MQEKKTLFVGQIVAQYTLIGHFDLVSTTSHEASSALCRIHLVPSLRRTRHGARGYGKDEKAKCFEGFSLGACSVQASVDCIAGRIMRERKKLSV